MFKYDLLDVAISGLIVTKINIPKPKLTITGENIAPYTDLPALLTITSSLVLLIDIKNTKEPINIIKSIIS